MPPARSFANSVRGRFLVPVLAGLSVGLTGCDTTGPSLSSVPATVAPYAAVLAVAPFSNESGVSIDAADRLAISDKLVSGINQTIGPDGSMEGGWRAVPVDRTLAAMQQLGLESIRTEAEAFAVMETIPVDGIILGSITDWSPYDPPSFGADLLLFGRGDRLEAAFDAKRLYGSTGDASNPGSEPREASAVLDLVVELDAVNHSVRQAVRTYAESHSDITGGFDPPERYYLMVFDRYLDFVADWAVGGLVSRERYRARTEG